MCCYQLQNYKIWKQFTTSINALLFDVVLLSITKLQNLKAIHNLSQYRKLRLLVVINRKITKFESNSQLFGIALSLVGGCYQSQHYKIWKQFTTFLHTNLSILSLLSITKLQNLKAIHNQQLVPAIATNVVINHKTTKFESNSQLTLSWFLSSSRCYQSQNYKIWKQFTTVVHKRVFICFII